MREAFLTLSETDITTTSSEPQGELVAGRTRYRRVTPTVSSAPSSSSRITDEKPFLNGNLYTGALSSGNVPHGAGKYLWSDGCMYEGEWRNGKASGKGKFSWPSGATYEGDFKAGKMDGLGTFIGADGDTYSGSWVCDQKHGVGEKRYANGDLYEGSWRANLQDGCGRYRWRNGNEYVGHWNKGVIEGKGVLVWANGNQYQGLWENGVPKGGGEFTWSGGIRRSKVLMSGEQDKSLQDLPRKRSSVDGPKDVNLPRICIWELDGEAGDITCDIVDNVEASMFYKDASQPNNPGAGAGPGDLQRSPCWSAIPDREVKKPGRTLSKGDKNYDLMLNVQLGIRYTVGKHASILPPLRGADFDPKEKFWTRFPPEGSKFTPPHPSVDFKWKDYCPTVFRHLRELFAIDPADYMLAICGNDALRELSSPGKSGSLFYLTQDDRVMIKTVKKSEVKVLIRMLPSYYQHVYQYKNSLMTKFLGVHCVKPVGGQKTRFIVMGNLFCSEYRIHRRFDLKGSSHGRTTDKAEGEIDETTTLKDLDLNFVFHLEPSWFQELVWQIDRDCEFLEAERIMDYSLLIGMHFCDDLEDEMKMPPSDIHGKKTHNDNTLMRGYHFIKAEQSEDWILEDRRGAVALGSNMPARAEQVQRRIQMDPYMGSGNGSSSSNNSTPTQNGGELLDVVLYFGIIDILQDYDISKKIEHAYKSLQVDPTSISAVDPKLYSKRFRHFIQRIFVEEKR